MKRPRRERVATAQTPVHKGVGHYGPPITLDQAKKAMAAAEAKARQNNWNVVISIVDSGGHAVMLQRLDGSHLAAIGIAEGKARTAVEFRRPTKALEDLMAGAVRCDRDISRALAPAGTLSFGSVAPCGGVPMLYSARNRGRWRWHCPTPQSAGGDDCVAEDGVRSETVSRPVLPAICDLQGDFQKLQGQPIRCLSNFVMASICCKVSP